MRVCNILRQIIGKNIGISLDYKIKMSMSTRADKTLNYHGGFTILIYLHLCPGFKTKKTL